MRPLLGRARGERHVMYWTARDAGLNTLVLAICEGLRTDPSAQAARGGSRQSPAMPLPRILTPIIRSSTAMIVAFSRIIQSFTPSRTSFDFDPKRKKMATGAIMPID